MNNSPVKSELYVALEMVELTQFLPFTNFSKCIRALLIFYTFVFKVLNFLQYITSLV